MKDHAFVFTFLAVAVAFLALAAPTCLHAGIAALGPMGGSR